METIKPVAGQLMSWADVKRWVDSMDEQQLAQAAFVITCNGQDKIIGTTTRPAAGGYPLPRLISGSTRN